MNKRIITAAILATISASTYASDLEIALGMNDGKYKINSKQNTTQTYTAPPADIPNSSNKKGMVFGLGYYTPFNDYFDGSVSLMYFGGGKLLDNGTINVNNPPLPSGFTNPPFATPTKEINQNLSATTKFTSLAFFIGGDLNLPINSIFIPFATAGVGFATNSVSTDFVTANTRDINLNIYTPAGEYTNKKNSFGVAYYFGAGVKIPFTDNLALVAKYTYTDFGPINYVRSVSFTGQSAPQSPPSTPATYQTGSTTVNSGTYNTKMKQMILAIRYTF